MFPNTAQHLIKTVYNPSLDIKAWNKMLTEELELTCQSSETNQEENFTPKFHEQFGTLDWL